MEKHIDPDEENLSKQRKLMTTIMILIISDKPVFIFVFNQWIIITMIIMYCVRQVNTHFNP